MHVADISSVVLIQYFMISVVENIKCHSTVGVKTLSSNGEWVSPLYGNPHQESHLIILYIKDQNNLITMQQQN